MHRIRVGLTGLACVFLVVMLAAAVLRMAGEVPKGNAAPSTNSAEAPNEPLAELGVAPGTPDDATTNSPSKEARSK